MSRALAALPMLAAACAPVTLDYSSGAAPGSGAGFVDSAAPAVETGGEDTAAGVDSARPAGPALRDTLPAVIGRGGEAPEDLDGDGFTVAEGDCDDAEAAVHPGAEEAWDWRDTDCDGRGDQITTARAAAWFSGAVEDYLGWRCGLSTGDFDGDGRLDLVVGGIFIDDYAVGGLYVLDGEGAEAWSGDITAAARASILGHRLFGYFSSMGQRQGDQDGDGRDDLVAGGTDAYASLYGEGAGALFFGGEGGLSDGVSDQGDVVFHDSRSAYGSASALGDADLDGDGRDDVIFADWAEAGTERGHVSVFSGAGLGAEQDLQSGAVFEVVGAGEGDHLGRTMAAADVSGDGLAELFVGAPGADTATLDVGCVYRVDGRSDRGGVEDVTSAASLAICGDEEGGGLGSSAPPQLADIDGDGALDLAISAPAIGRVYIFFDVGRLAGEGDVGDADITLASEAPSQFGFSLASGDFDGDGLVDLAAGAPGASEVTESADGAGVVRVFTGAALSAGATQSSANAQLEIVSESVDHFGAVLAAGDLSGDGRDDLVAAAPTHDGLRGRVWIFMVP